MPSRRADPDIPVTKIAWHKIGINFAGLYDKHMLKNPMFLIKCWKKNHLKNPHFFEKNTPCLLGKKCPAKFCVQPHPRVQIFGVRLEIFFAGVDA